ncbi:MAG: insulinase family protein [Candidatus Omnitrophica bacterium]|nr:insulinase family protein [Candidatus Omnitrophota bacterium]
MPSATRNATSQPAKLPGGLSVVVRPMAHAESVAVGVWIKVGGRYERSALSGISHVLEHLLFKGTRTRSCEQLTQAIEGIGGSLNGFTAEEFTCYMAKVPAKHLDRALAVLSDMVLHPAFRPDDFEKEREVILEEIRMYEDAPAQYVQDLFNQLLWPNHPLGNLLSGTMATVRGIRRQDAVAHWRRFYHPRNMLVACAGALDPDRVLRRLRRAFAGRRPGLAGRVAPAPRAARGPQVRLYHKDTEQTHLCLGTPAMPRTHPQRFALELVHVLLGANMSSRLFHEVREKRGLVYEIGTQIKRYHDTGAFIISAGCDAAKLATTIQTVVEELRRIKRHRVGPQELRRAKDFYAGQLLMGLEDTMDHMLWMGEQAVTVGRIADARDVIQALERVSPEQIRRAARALFTPERCYLTAIGPVPEEEAEILRTLCRP